MVKSRTAVPDVDRLITVLAANNAPRWVLEDVVRLEVARREAVAAVNILLNENCRYCRYVDKGALMNQTTTIDNEIADVQSAAAALKDTRLMLRGGSYLVGGDGAVVAMTVVEKMMQADLIRRVGSGMYELTLTGKKLAREGGQS